MGQGEVVPLAVFAVEGNMRIELAFGIDPLPEGEGETQLANLLPWFTSGVRGDGVHLPACRSSSQNPGARCPSFAST